MQTVKHSTIDELWDSVRFAKVDPDGILSAAGFKLRAWIKHIDGASESVVLTYAPDMGRDKVLSSLLLFAKGRGSMCVDSIQNPKASASGVHKVANGRSIEWGTRTVRDASGNALGPASAARWESGDGETCILDGTQISPEFVLEVASALAQADSG